MIKITTTDIKDHLVQPSTIKGISLILSAFGVTVGTEVLQALSTIVLFGLGLWETGRDENKQR